MIGVTVLPEYLQSESVASVVDNLIERAGVTAIATSPYVMELADEQTGIREPPADAGAGKVRLLDRPLWGHRELWVRTSPSFQPDASLYEGLRYQPPPTDRLTSEQGHVVQELIEYAHNRGIVVYFQVQAAIPPGYRVQFGGPIDDDIPKLPNGEAPARRVANNASLASPHVLQYQQALIRDLLQAYPDIDGLRFDWPEYPPYFLDTAFLDFGIHAERAAGELGYDFAQMRHEVGQLYDQLNGQLTNDDLRSLATNENVGLAALQLTQRLPGITDWLKFKADLSLQLLTTFRKTMDECSTKHVDLAPTAFPPPWSLISGMDFSQNRSVCDSLSVKLYGMHWAMMLGFYGEQLMERNDGLTEQDVVSAIAHAFDIVDGDAQPTLSDYHYPEPDEPHPIGAGAQTRKIQEAQKLAGDTPIVALAHGYGPVDDFRRRIAIANEASAHGFWVNRYGYLSDPKLDIIGTRG